MEILTGTFCGEAAHTALLLRRTVRRKGKTPIVFVCVMRGREALFRKQLMNSWFQEKVLPLCERNKEDKAVDAVKRSFALCLTQGGGDMAALFCMGRECFYAWHGEMELYAVNLCFDRGHLKKLSFPPDGQNCERAVLEQGVGIVLGNHDFFTYLTEEQLKECLRAGMIHSQEQAQRHLEEAAKAAKRQGGQNPTAAMLLIREENTAELGGLLLQNGYEDILAVGHGAFGKVYRVKNVRNGRRYACKVAEDMDSRGLLRREAALQQSLGHPLFARYEAVLEGETCTLLLMEYVKGQDLSLVLSRKALSEKQSLRIAIQLAEGLQYLHTLPEPVLYRDLKPENIRITLPGRVKLLDLGCACRLSEAALTRAGSRGYAAPEQLGQISASPGFYSDIYSLGRLLVRMTEKAKISPGLSRLISICISENPSERFQSMTPLLDELNMLVDNKNRRVFPLEQ